MTQPFPYLPQELTRRILQQAMITMNDRERARLRVALRSHVLPSTNEQDAHNQLAKKPLPKA